MNKHESIRQENIRYMQATNYRGDGCRGCCNELEHRLTDSRFDRVAGQNVPDCSIRFQKPTWKQYKTVNAENKTGGGRIDFLLDYENNTDDTMRTGVRFVVYTYFFRYKRKGKGGAVLVDEFEYPAIVVPTAEFIETLKAFGALKAVNHGGVQDGVAIQVSNKRFREWCANYPVRWEQGRIYTPADWE